MTTLQAVAMGLVQGLTEFLPVSSSAHLRIAPELLGMKDPGAAFTAVVQLGTLVAVLLYFRADLSGIARATWRGTRDASRRDDPEFRLGVVVLVGTLPIIAAGVVFRDAIETTFRDLQLIGWTLIVFGLVMEAADRLSRSDRDASRIGIGHGLLVGCAQALALIPGVSRSGATITAGRILGLERASAARFSFLLSVPAVVLSAAFEARHIGTGSLELLPVAVATLAAFVSGYLSIAFLLRFLQTHHLTVFTAWRVAVGAAVLIVLA